MTITNHAKDRLKERCGLNKKSKDRMVQRVLKNGIHHRDTKGRLHKWITSLYFNNKDDNNIRVYGQKAYIFHSDILITVIEIPNNLKKDMSKMLKN